MAAMTILSLAHSERGPMSTWNSGDVLSNRRHQPYNLRPEGLVRPSSQKVNFVSTPWCARASVLRSSFVPLSRNGAEHKSRGIRRSARWSDDPHLELFRL